MEKVGNFLWLFVLLIAICGFESAMNIQTEHDLCKALCSELTNGFPEENPKAIERKQIFQDSLLGKKCDCFKVFKSDLKRKRRSIATSKPQPTTSMGNQTIKQNSTDTDEKEKSKEVPGYRPEKNINFASHLIYCNYTVGELDKKTEGKELDDIKVIFKSQDRRSFNVTWHHPEADVDNVSNYLVMWNGQRKPNEPPDIKHSFVHCKKVSKNQTYTVIEENDGWEYPQSVYLAVVTIPQDVFSKSITLHAFNPIEPVIVPVPPRHRRKDVKLQTWSIATGVIVGVIFISLLFVLLYRKKCKQSEIPDNEVDIAIPFVNNSDGLPKVLNVSKPKNVDVYFGSYLPENEKYANQVATIAGMLRANGYRVVFDQVDSVELNSMGFNLWVEKQILEAKKYIVFCSPGYVNLWQTLATNAQDDKLNHVNKEDLVRVRYEIKRITDIYSESCSTSKIICIKMDPKMSTKSVPPWMNHNMLLWPEQKFDIIRRLNDQAAMVMEL